MDPGRAAMIAGGRSRRSPERRDPTGPRRDNRTRIVKPYAPGPSHSGSGYSSGSNSRQPYHGNSRDSRSRPSESRNNGSGPSDARGGGQYMTEEQLSERFVAQEDSFVLKQSKSKADIRVRERRAKPIDLLAFNLRFVDEDHDTFDDKDTDADIEYPLPDAVIASADDAALDELEADVKSFRTLEKRRANRRYWQAVLVLVRAARDERRERRHGAQQLQRQASDVVLTDVDKILHTKTLAQLEEMEKKIEAKLRSDETLETDHWEQMLKRLHVWKAKAELAVVNDASRAKRLALRKEAAAARAAAGGGADDDKAGIEEKDSDDGEPSTAVTKTTTAASGGDAPPPGTERFSAVASEDFSQATRALYEREVARGVSENEEIFAAEEVVPTASAPKWSDKYRPRKPRYFNRVQMGYEWNKYNQTHYDHDNPPPKVVQGYKFNIFYPELIDKTKAPTYHITREGGRRKGESFAPAGEEDTCLIRFSAGPPYEDIAFRIVDREWDYSAKRERGFRSVFEKGILQLHFQFKKIYYRK
ncbi:hypothetical protein SPBR_02709 [Sporothrix brasiliensis 5110]|uniref:Splicing factor Cactin n=1 Tax=Sporothrix brasiliensis 5110 TaxID=1398154 RepID=A0A0C2FQB2_9PEZI|nr:uncharacterized protein SPBR_02709 [Sporothrix brasiliensis 5110]KIH93228.1 hypothetical protein SPBR_02709 [Sporothrix brasiliensis 5110]